MRSLRVCFVAILFAASGAAHAQSIQGLGWLEDDQGNRAVPNAISADGQVIVGRSQSSEGGRAFRWTAESGMVSLGVLPSGGASASYGEGVSADGSVVVGYNSDPDSTQAVIWTSESGLVGLGDVAEGTASTRLEAVSADGTVAVGRAFTTEGERALLWRAGSGLITLTAPGATSSGLYAISADGTIAAGFIGAGAEREPARWTAAGGLQTLGAISGTPFPGLARAVSADGTVIGGELRGDMDGVAFRWTEGDGMESLATLPVSTGNGAAVYSLSADGSFAGGRDQAPTTGVDGVIWTDDGTIRRLEDTLPADYGIDLDGWLLGTVLAMTPDGRVLVGAGINPDGVEEAWRVELSPATSAEPLAPEAFGLTVVPNPASGGATVSLSARAPEAVRVAAYDALGREVAVLHDGPLASDAAWPLPALAPGVYVVRAVTPEAAVSARATVVR